MANGGSMAMSEAAKRADQKYKAEKTSQVVLRFYPKDADVLAHLRSQESMQGYIKRLIREDMGAWYRRVSDEVECRLCGFIMGEDDAAMLSECPSCHGEE